MDATADGSTAWLGDRDGAVEAVDTRQGPDCKPAQVPCLPVMLSLFLSPAISITCSFAHSLLYIHVRPADSGQNTVSPVFLALWQICHQAKLHRRPACVASPLECHQNVFIWSPGVVVSTDFSIGPPFQRTRLPHLAIGTSGQSKKGVVVQSTAAE